MRLQLATGQAAQYDAITFNFGLHDLGNLTADVETYSKQLAAIAERERAKLLRAQAPRPGAEAVSATPRASALAAGGAAGPGAGAARAAPAPAVLSHRARGADGDEGPPPSAEVLVSEPAFDAQECAEILRPTLGPRL